MASLIWLDEIASDDRARAGGKAFVLGRLRQAGFAVPDGFVVPADAPEIGAAAGAAYRRLTSGAVAVRSSSGAEDGDEASFAGQYVTLLDVRGETALVAAIEECRAGTSRADAYAGALGVTGDRVAVLVQKFVEPRAAGVVFTRDPQDENTLIVEAHAGRGEAVVSGVVRPARFRVARDTGAVSHEGPDGVLSSDDLQALVALARRIEAHLGGAQDIEWAWADDEGLVVLQARPITVASEERPDPRLRRLTRANVGEVMPGPMTPLAWSVLGAFLEHAFRHETARIHVLPDDAPAFLVLHHRRLYLNLDLAIEVASRMPGVSAADVEKLVLGAGATRGHEPRRSEHRPLRTLLGLARLARALPGEIRTAERAFAARPTPGAVASADAATLAAMMDELAGVGRTVASAHVNTSGASGVAMAILERLIARDKRGDARERTARLLAGLDDVASVAPAIALESIAARARQEAEWRAWLDRDEATIAADYASARGPVALRGEIDAFLVRFGHRGLSEGDVSARSWDEDSRPVFASLRVLLGADRSPGFGPRARCEIRLADEEAILCRAGLLTRPLLRYLIPTAQQWVRRREETKSLAVAMVRHARRVLQAAVALFTAGGRLPDPALVDFFSFEEIQAALRGTPLPVAEARRRRRRHASEAQLPAPREVDLQAAAAAATIWTDADALRGIGVSPGIAIGKARVAGAGIPALAPGEILVAPVLDAALAPLLATAAGAVVEIGGILSHGSVVAREMGVPCVVDVREATQRIRTGETLIVDGGSGLVRRAPPVDAATAESRALFPTAVALDTALEGLHPLEDHPLARESVYLNMRDPARGLALVFSMAVRPRGRGEALLTLSLPDGRVLFGIEMGRAVVDAGGFRVGGYRLNWNPLRLEIDADVAPHESSTFPPGPLPLLLAPRTTHLRGALTLAPTTSAIDFCDILPAEAREWLRALGSHHVEQSGRWRGALECDGATLAFDGRGSRDHSWGRRDWEAADHWRLFMAPLDDRLAAHALIVSVGGRLVSGGAIWRDGRAEVVSRVEYAARRDARGRVRSFELELTTPRGPTRLVGEIEQTVSIPVQPERRLWRHLAGRPYRLVLHENFTRYEMEGVCGHGMAELTERPD